MRFESSGAFSKDRQYEDKIEHLSAKTVHQLVPLEKFFVYDNKFQAIEGQVGQLQSTISEQQAQFEAVVQSGRDSRITQDEQRKHIDVIDKSFKAELQDIGAKHESERQYVCKLGQLLTCLASKVQELDTRDEEDEDEFSFPET